MVMKEHVTNVKVRLTEEFNSFHWTIELNGTAEEDVSCSDTFIFLFLGGSVENKSNISLAVSFIYISCV